MIIQNFALAGAVPRRSRVRGGALLRTPALTWRGRCAPIRLWEAEGREAVSERDQGARPRRPGRLLRGFTGWRLRDLGPDLLAGLTLAAIAIPEQMATARLAGFPPSAGFVALIAARLASRCSARAAKLSVGANSTIAPIFAGTLAAAGASGLAGYADLAAGAGDRGRPDPRPGRALAVRLHRRSALDSGHDRLSSPASRSHIVVSQAPDALGLDARVRVRSWRKVGALAARLGSANLVDACALASGCSRSSPACEAISPRIPGALIGVAAATGFLSVCSGSKGRASRRSATFPGAA